MIMENYCSNWNQVLSAWLTDKYPLKVTIEAQNYYLDYVIDPYFQKVNRIFVLSLENIANGTKHTGHFLPTAEIKDYNVMINGRDFFAQAIKII